MPTSKDFLITCRQCGAWCCMQVLPPVTKKEKERIISAGFPDYFSKVSENVYTIQATNKGICPYLQSNNSCKIQTVKPQLCQVWPVIPRIENGQRGFLIIHCPIYPLLSSETLTHAKSEAAQIPPEIIHQLWSLSPNAKKNYKRFTYEKQ
jgi:Fe-S-cluster containining protein